jgi:hypothetical protein
MSKQQVLEEIKAHIAQRGGAYSSWYAGIASDAKDRLFNDHAVKENGDFWIFRTCDSSVDARSVEDALFRLGAKGGPGGGDSTTKAVYAYKISTHTIE